MLLCVIALGTSAATLESTLASGPLDGLEPNWSELPLSEEEAADIKDAIDIRDELDLEEDAEVDASDEPEPTAVPPQSVDVSARGGPGAPARPGSSSGPEVAVHQRESSDDDPLDGLFTLLLPAAVATAIGLGYRYRERLQRHLAPAIAPVRGLAPSDGERDPMPSRATGRTIDHEVDRAWARLVGHLDFHEAPTRTPGECARVAKAAGLPPEPVETITRTYEEVRYGGKPVTEDRRRRVRRSLRQLELEGESA